VTRSSRRHLAGPGASLMALVLGCDAACRVPSGSNDRTWCIWGGRVWVRLRRPRREPSRPSTRSKRRRS
jgi:hypothetical protein